MTATLTTAEIAADLNTTPRTLRKFLRSDDAKSVTPVGKGHRYAIEAKHMRSLRSQFSKWTAAQETAKADKATNADNAPETDEGDEG